MLGKKLLELAALFLPKVKYVGHERLNMYVHRKKSINQSNENNIWEVNLKI